MDCIYGCLGTVWEYPNQYVWIQMQCGECLGSRWEHSCKSDECTRSHVLVTLHALLTSG